MPRVGSLQGYEVFWILSYFCSALPSQALVPGAEIPQTPPHKIKMSSFPNFSGTKPWLHSTSHRWPSLKSFYGAVFEVQASAPALFYRPVSFWFHPAPDLP